MIDYYRKRAKYLEDIYHIKDRKRLEEQQLIETTILNFFKNKDILEIACGTGYWTEKISKVASKIIALDLLEEMITIAKFKSYSCSVDFIIGDIESLPFNSDICYNAFMGFLISHIPKEDYYLFFKNLHRVFKNGAMIFILDNVFNEKYGGELIKNQYDKNTYKLRVLENGERYKIIKNYFTLNELLELFVEFDENFTQNNIFYGTNFWFLYYFINYSKKKHPPFGGF